MLIVLAGLPGAGKSAVAEDLARSLPAAVLSVDPVEAAMWRAGIDSSQPTGIAAYGVVETMAAEQLALGHPVIVDAVNAVEVARQQWRDLAARTAQALRFIEVRCSDEDVHRRRLEGRRRSIEGFPEPSWSAVQDTRRSFAQWAEPRLVLDSVVARDENLRTALAWLADAGPGDAADAADAADGADGADGADAQST